MSPDDTLATDRPDAEDGGSSRPRGADTEDGSDGRLQEVARRLEQEYGPPDKPRRDPLDELVLTILSQNTADTNSRRAWERLRERFPNWEAVRRADPAEVEEAIRPGGLAGQKSTAIQDALERIHDERGELSLEHLRRMDDDEALEYLTGFKRVGTKTAACVLCFALRRPVMPVDTHVLRVSRRLGLVPEDADAGAAHDTLNRAVPPERRYPMHVQMIRHGRAVCSARSPDCPECVLEDVCPQVGLESR